jgi:phage terminase large subunit-like protein
LVAETAADGRDVMVEGPAGLLSISPPWERPVYQPSKRRLTWNNGATATIYSADDPEQLRGPQHDGAWCDEIAKWRYGMESWDNLMLGMRLGTNPQVVATTTPKPVPLVKMLIQDSKDPDSGVVMTTGTTYENLQNLAPAFRRTIMKFEGTRKGKQELLAMLLEDNPGALWNRSLLDTLRIGAGSGPLANSRVPEFTRIVIGVDPNTGGVGRGRLGRHQAQDSSVDEDDGYAETGIIIVAKGVDNHGYVLDDFSLAGSPAEWASKVLEAYILYRADLVVGEANQGGRMVEATMRNAQYRPETIAGPASTVHSGRNLPIKLVWASRGKTTRAEPISQLYEQGRFHHIGTFAELEEQMCEWQPGMESPDRMDALVWAGTELFVEDDNDDESEAEVW